MREKVDGFWDMGILRIEEPALDTELSLLPEDLSLQVAGWLAIHDGTGATVTIPLTAEDIERMREWLMYAGENVLERRRRSHGGRS